MSEPVTFIQMLHVRNAMLLHICFLTRKKHSILHVIFLHVNVLPVNFFTCKKHKILHVKSLNEKVLHVKVLRIPGGSCQD